MADAPSSARTKKVDARRRRVRRARSTGRSCTSSCAPSSPPAGRARTPPRRAARSAAAAPSRGARRAPAAPAPARSARRIWTGGGIVFGPSPRHYIFKVNRKERRAALRSALSRARRRAARSRVFDPPGFDAPSTKQAAALLADWAAAARCSSSSAEEQARPRKSFRNLARVSVLAATSDRGVADLVGAAPARLRRRRSTR